MKKRGSEYLDLTQHEIQALKHEYNLADAHTHQSQSPSQRKIVASLPKLWYEAEKTKQHDLEQAFVKTFFRGQKQYYALKPNNAMLVYAASIGMVITANYLMKKNMSVTLIEPCFDNLPDILHNMKIKVKPLKEEFLYDPKKVYDNLKKQVTTDALFLVDPNNPTGFSLFHYGKKAYKEIIRFCKDYKKILIMDYCFGSFLLSGDFIHLFDVYELFEKSGVSYITMEDTGKTWPVQDAKVALLKTSKDLYEDIYNIHTSYLLNVSPFLLRFLEEYLLDSERTNFASTFGLFSVNREIAKKELSGKILEYLEPLANVSVAWFKIKDPKIKATELQQYIFQKKKVYILPGTYFFWNDRPRGEQYIRIALARDTKMFKPAIRLIHEAVEEYAR